jgi:hypothetical protein
MEPFRNRVTAQLERWRLNGLPGHTTLHQQARELATLRQKGGMAGLWPWRPLMLAATLDDAIGQGIAVIRHFAAAVGMEVIDLGLCRSPEAILAACRDHRPELLGLTVLQFTSEEELARIGSRRPTECHLVVGGPIFKADPALAGRCGCDFVAQDVAAFLNYLLNTPWDRSEIS